MRRTLLALTCVSALLGGCAELDRTFADPPSGPTPTAGSATAVTPLPPAQSALFGGSGIVQDTNGRSWSMRALESYQSASGTECRKVMLTPANDPAARSLERVACRDGAKWRLSKPLQAVPGEPTLVGLS